MVQEGGVCFPGMELTPQLATKVECEILGEIKMYKTLQHKPCKTDINPQALLKEKRSLNRSSWRKRGVASTPLFITPGFFLHFSLEPSYGYLRFEGNGKIPLGR